MEKESCLSLMNSASWTFEQKILVGTTQLWPQQQVTMMGATRAAAIRMAEIQTDNDD